MDLVCRDWSRLGNSEINIKEYDSFLFAFWAPGMRALFFFFFFWLSLHNKLGVFKCVNILCWHL